MKWRWQRKPLVAVATVLVAISVLASTAFAIDPQDNRPFWTGVPSGGLYEECIGQIITLGGYGLVPARSTYTEAEYSSGGTCNLALTRPFGMLEATVETYSEYVILCDSKFRQNTAGASGVVATGANCQFDPTRAVWGLSYYDSVGAGYPDLDLWAT